MSFTDRYHAAFFAIGKVSEHWLNSKGAELITEYERRHNCRIDFAVPQSWYDAVSRLGVEPRDYVWCYSEAARHGAPLHRHTILASILQESATDALRAAVTPSAEVARPTRQGAH